MKSTNFRRLLRAVATIICTHATLGAANPQIHNFKVQNGSITFQATASKTNNDSVAPPLPNAGAFSLALRDERPIPLDPSPNATRDTLNFALPVPYGVFPGKYLFNILYQEESILKDVYDIPQPLITPGEQPIITDIHPRGTSPGKTVTIQGRGFGDNLDNIYLWFTSEKDTLLPAGISQILNPSQPTYLTTPDANGIQELKFVLPGSNSVGETLSEGMPNAFLEYNLRLRVVVQGQPSANATTLSLVTKNYRWYLIGIVLLIVAALVGLFILADRMAKRKNPALNFSFKQLFIDPVTGRLSLSKTQAVTWTIILVISYTYFASMAFLILDENKIPDFDPSLLILMGISTTGLLIARTQDKSQQAKTLQSGKAIEKAPSSSVWDLISENGTISLAKLQLAAFTLVAMGIFIVHMTSNELVEEGLPVLPTTLLALMGISQGGYISGKAVENGGNTPLESAGAKATEEESQEANPAQPPT